MAIYIDSDGNYPRYTGDIYLIAPSWQEGNTLPSGWHQVVEVERPASDEVTYVYEDYPTQISGIFYQNWITRPYTEQELAAMSERINLLATYADAKLTQDLLSVMRDTP